MSRIPVHTRREDGTAIMMVIVLTVLATMLVAGITTVGRRDADRSRDFTSKTMNVPLIDRALGAYEYALEAELVNDGTNFQINAATMQQLAQLEPGTATKVVPNTSFATTHPDFVQRFNLQDTLNATGYQYSLSTELPNGTVTWWQLYNVIPFTGTNPNLVAYIRAWSSTKTGKVIGEPRTVRAELRPALFSDFQMMVDGPINLGGDSQIRGQIHSNGYPDAYLHDIFTTPGRPIKLGDAGNRPECYQGSGFSTATGTLEGTCNMQWGASLASITSENNGKLVDLMRGRDILKTLTDACARGNASCAPSGYDTYHIRLSGSGAQVYSNANMTGLVAQVNATVRHGLLIPGNATLQGQLTSGQLTIGVLNPGGSFNVNGSAQLRLLGSGTVGSSNSSTLGLVVEGDVIPAIDTSTANCVSTLRAAVMTTSGAISVPQSYRVPMYPGGTMPQCNKPFHLIGSLASHYAPLVRVSWSPYWAGYSSSIYEYDTRLRASPPPMFPQTGPWQLSSWRDAIIACLDRTQKPNANCG